MIYIGVDPGTSGAIATVTDMGHSSWVKCAETEHDLWEFLSNDVFAANAGERFHAVIEQVHSMPNQGVSSSFKFGQSYGFLRGLLTAHAVPFETVTPQKWQKAMGCRSGGDKNVTKAAAQRLFPGLKITHANADALLLAEYCRRINNQRRGHVAKGT